MSSYLSTVTSYLKTTTAEAQQQASQQPAIHIHEQVVSFVASYFPSRGVSTPVATALPSADDTLKQNQAVYQEIFSLLAQLKLHLDRKEYGAFLACWKGLSDYQEIWTTKMSEYLDPVKDGQYFDMWFKLSNTLPLQVLHQKLSGCIKTTHALTEMTPLERRSSYQDLFGHLLQLEFYLNQGTFIAFHNYARTLDQYQGMWTEEMNEHLNLVSDYPLLSRELNPQQIGILKNKLISCMRIVQKSAWDNPSFYV